MTLDILLISPFPPRLGGSAISNAALAEGLTSNYGHSFNVISQGNGQSDLEKINDSFWLGEGIPIHRITIPYQPSVIEPTAMRVEAINSELRNILGQIKKPDIAIVGYEGWALHTPLLKQFDLPVVTVLGGRPTAGLPEGIYSNEFIKRYIDSLNLSDAIIPKSKDLAEIVIGFGINKEKVHVVPNGINTDHFNPYEQDDTREQLHIPKDAYVFVHTSNLKPFKRTLDIVEAAPYVLKKHPNSNFLIVGDGSLYQNMVERSNELGVQNHFRFVGKQERKRVPFYLNAGDVYIMSSDKGEGCPTAVIEAMACGLPVISSNIPAHEELVNYDGKGLVYSVGNISELADRMSYAVSNPKNTKQLAEVRRKYVLANLTEQVRFTKYNSLLATVTPKKLAMPQRSYG